MERQTIVRQLTQRVRLSGSQALALSTVLTNAVRILSTMVLTRLLSPDVYGISGMIVSVFYAINLLSDAGFQPYIVRHDQGDETDFLSAVWTIHAGRGLVQSVIAALLAWPVSLALAKPDLAAPLAVASITFAIDGQASLHQFRALRNGGVQRFATLNLAVGVSQAFAAILLAIFFRNIWAIIGAMLFASVVRVRLSYGLFGGRRHSIRADRRVAADLWQFSRVIAASSALTLLITQVDKLAMGRIMPLSQFGTYVIASTLAVAPTVFAYNYATTIVYPAVAAAVREDKSPRDAYYRSCGRLFYAYIFGGGILIGSANLLVRLLYDPRYLTAALYLSILAVGTAMIMVTRSMESVLVATGRVRATLEMNVARLVWLLAGGAFALAKASPIMFVWTIGLIQAPAYCYACWGLHRLHLLNWKREVSGLLIITAGFGLGSAASYLGGVVLPNL